MSLIEVDTGVYVNPDEVVSIEDQKYWNNDSPSDSFLESTGCRIILKNGRKLYLKRLRAIDAHDLLFQKMKDIVPCSDTGDSV